MWHFELFKMKLTGIMIILNYEKYGEYIYIYIYIYIMCVNIPIHEQDEYLKL